MNGKIKAAIDIGSNSVRLALSDGRTFSRITQLALGIESSGVLSPRGVEQTVKVLAEYVGICGDTVPVTFATEAVRRAKDGEDFIKLVKAQTGLDVKLLSGEQEAALALSGVTKPSGAAVVCDLGGGSMEVICSADGKTARSSVSLPLGVVVMKNRFNGDFRAAIDQMPALVAQFGDIPPYPITVCGGSACTVAAGILNLKAYDKAAVTAKFTARQLDDFLPIAFSPNLALYRPVCAKRADTLAYGAIVIQAFLNHAHATEFYVSDASNLEAVLNGFEI